jgi:glycyl-tRNA synthetase beta chain
MVYEFPELQGLMGRYYALEQGVEPKVADAIRDHYKPQGQSDDLPTNEIGVAVSLADKLDTLAAFWSIDQKPTGSRDPFALRRAALAVIRMVLEGGLRLSLLKAFADHPKVGGDQSIASDLLAFFHDRLTVYFRDQGFRHDRVAAALREGDDDFVLVEKRLKALSGLLDTPEGENLTAAYKRASNILKAEARKGALPDADPDPAKLTQTEERALHEALDKAEEGAKSALEGEDFAAAMKALASVRSEIDAFFDKVTVNADDEALRANRLAQLSRFRNVVNLVADFDRLEG